ncbi:MAG: dual specificity protein phosphatase family protein [Planctomycetota bacterium]
MLNIYRFRLLAVVFILGLSALTACNCQQTQTQAAGTANIFATPRDDIHGLSNFAKVSDVLYRGAQPEPEGFAELKKMGIKTVINLRDNHSDVEMMKGLGLQYCLIPCEADDVEEEKIAAFLKVATDPKNQPVFAHCAHGADRTGLMVASYRIYVQGWKNEDALAETDLFGRHKIYKDIPKYIKAFDKEAIKNKIQTVAEPKIETIE